MSRDLEQLLHDTAVEPADTPDPSILVARGRRRRLRRRAAGAAAGVVAAVVAGVMVLQAVPTGSEPQILDQPPGGERSASVEPGEGDSQTDADRAEAAERVQQIEQEERRLRELIAEVEAQMAEIRKARESNAEERQRAVEEGADDAELERLAAVQASLEAQEGSLLERLRMLQEQLRAVPELGQTAPAGPERDDDRDELDVPLAGRFAHTVTWTGDEVIVWGGEPTYNETGPGFGDGAAYDPGTDRWRMLPTPPVVDTSYHVAVWSGTEVLFFGGRQDPRQVLAFHPDTGAWRTGAPLPFDLTKWTGDAIWIQDRALVLTDDGLVAYDPVADVWSDLPAPPLEVDDDGGYALFLDDTGRVVAVGGARSGTGGIDVAVRSSDGRWQPGPDLPEVIGAADGGDSYAEHPRPKLTVLTDAGLLFVPSAGEPIPAMLWQLGDDDWVRLDVPPKAGCEDIPEPVAIGGGAVTTGCEPDDAVWFNPDTREFEELALTGPMQDGHVVWTGTELVAVVGWCCETATGSVMVSWRQPLPQLTRDLGGAE